MRLIFSLLAGFIIGTNAYGQAVKKCDTSVVVATQNNAGQLALKEITDFLLTFGKECQNNVEFSEFSNEVLFLVFDEQTELILKAIEQGEKEIDLNEILDDLSSPVSDLIVVKDLIPKVEKVKIDKKLKKLILNRLNTAATK